MRLPRWTLRVSGLALIGLLLAWPLLSPPQGTAQSAVQFFPQTGHTVRGAFLPYWQQHGGLAQQGYPLTEEFAEKNKLDGKTYTVQYFERAVFELHPENKAPFDVLLSQLGTFRYRAKYAQAAAVNVNIVDFKFDPQVITITAGTTVTWTEIGPTEHNTVYKGNRPLLWESDIMHPGDKFSYTFTKPGTYDYWCTIHPEMLAKVIVK
jgi:plastocyanin